MKNVVMSIIGLAVAIGLVFGALLPVAERGKVSATYAIEKLANAESGIDKMSEPVWKNKKD